ncbi:MAG TPA: hypothetical protein VH252_00990, partial [Chthoniobacterales bacterium]|nr:hypothetical protein [Chthoniobacterales bacterium]
MNATARCLSLGAILFLLLPLWARGQQKPPRTIAGPVADHPVTASGVVVAQDLDHGVAAAGLRISRSWLGRETLNTHFGPGWSDTNDVRLTLVDTNTLVIWRGGIGWHTAHKKGDVFEGAGGETIRQTGSGWSAERPDRGALLFDNNGRLTTDKPAAGPACNYTYANNGRLTSLGTSPENQLRYQYDKAGKRVVHVDGPEGLQLDYRYDNKGRLVGLTNSRKIAIEYRYSEAGELVAIKDQFGFEFTPGKNATVVLPKVSAQDLPALSRAKDEVSYQREKNGKIEARNSAAGKTVYTYDKFGRIATVQEPDGQGTKFEYNNLDLPTRIVASDGRTEKLTYDEHGRATRREAAPDNWLEFVYDGGGRLEVERRAPGAETRYSYNALDQPVRIRHASGAEVEFEYDANGKPTREKWST